MILSSLSYALLPLFWVSSHSPCLEVDSHALLWISFVLMIILLQGFWVWLLRCVLNFGFEKVLFWTVFISRSWTGCSLSLLILLLWFCHSLRFITFGFWFILSWWFRIFTLWVVQIWSSCSSQDKVKLIGWPRKFVNPPFMSITTMLLRFFRIWQTPPDEVSSTSSLTRKENLFVILHLTKGQIILPMYMIVSSHNWEFGCLLLIFNVRSFESSM